MTVSIIIPIYNVALYIESCLWSVMRQTYQGDIECLIVDDCSTDGSLKICERLISDYSGHIIFHIFHHERNKGLSAARNTGTLNATGNYLFYLDGDDELTDDCIEKLIGPCIENPDVEMVQGNRMKYPIQGNPIQYLKDITLPVATSNEEVRRCFYNYRQMNVSAWNKLIRRDFIMRNGLLFREGIIYEDFLYS